MASIASRTMVACARRISVGMPQKLDWRFMSLTAASCIPSSDNGAVPRSTVSTQVLSQRPFWSSAFRLSTPSLQVPPRQPFRCSVISTKISSLQAAPQRYFQSSAFSPSTTHRGAVPTEKPNLNPWNYVFRKQRQIYPKFAFHSLAPSSLLAETSRSKAANDAWNRKKEKQHYQKMDQLRREGARNLHHIAGKVGEDVTQIELQKLKDEGIIRDFLPQPTYPGTKKRPDFVVTLHNDQVLFIDSKASTDWSRDRKHHVDILKGAVKEKGKRDYPSLVPNAYKDLVMFLPYNRDLERAYDDDGNDDLNLHGYAKERNVRVESPSTLRRFIVRLNRGHY